MHTIRYYPYEAGRTLYPIDFALGFLSREHVYVYVGDDPLVQVDYTWVNAGQISLVLPILEGQQLKIRRSVQTTLFNDFENGSRLSSKNLDSSFLQALMLHEEVLDGFLGDEFRLQSNKLIVKHLEVLNKVEVPEPSAGNEATSKNYVDGEVTNLRSYVDTGVNALRQYIDTADNAVKQYVDGIITDAINTAVGSSFVGEFRPVITRNGMTWYKPSESTTYTYLCEDNVCKWVQTEGASTLSTPFNDIDVKNFSKFATSGDATGQVQAAVDYALSIGTKRIRCDVDLVCNFDVTRRGDVQFFGSGSITGAGFYRKTVKPYNASKSYPDLSNGLVPEKHLKNFSKSSTPNVVITGSSTGTFKPEAIDFASSFYNVLTSTMKRVNKSKSINFINRAIGGQTFGRLSTTPTSFPSWYTDQNKAWLDYIGEDLPDAIFIVMGSNDSSTFSNGALQAVVAKIKTFSKPCDIIFVTQPAPSLNSTGTFSGFATKAGQEGRDYSAGAIRAYAEYFDYGLIDANRWVGLIADGRDILNTYSKQVLSNVNLPTGRYDAPVDFECRDYSVTLEFTGDLTAINNAFSTTVNTTNPVRFKLGSGTSDSVFVRKNSLGNFRLELYSTNASPTSGNGYNNVDTTIPFPTSSFQLEVTKKGNWLTLSVVGSEDTTRMEYMIRTHGGVFQPEMGYFGLTTGCWSRLISFSVGVEKPYAESITMTELWGASSDTAATKLPYGGNGVNHLSSIGNTAVWYPLLNTNLNATNVPVAAEYVPVVTADNGIVTSVSAPHCRFSVVDGLVTVSGYFAANLTSETTSVFTLKLPVERTGTTATPRLSGVWSTLLGGKNGVVQVNATDPTVCRIQATLDAGLTNVHFNLTYTV